MGNEKKKKVKKERQEVNMTIGQISGNSEEKGQTKPQNTTKSR